jgi:hypothetical protein
MSPATIEYIAICMEMANKLDIRTDKLNDLSHKMWGLHLNVPDTFTYEDMDTMADAYMELVIMANTDWYKIAKYIQEG